MAIVILQVMEGHALLQAAARGCIPWIVIVSAQRAGTFVIVNGDVPSVIVGT